jgi:hypothetical protein
MRLWSLAWVLPLCLVSCGDKSAVSLTITLDQATVTATNGTFDGATLDGGFELKFELGPEASGSTTVTLGTFAVQSAAGAVLVDQLKLDSGGTSFPLVVNKGSSQMVRFTLTSMKPLAASERDALCAGQVQIIGSVVDTLKSGTDSLSSNLITPTCT